MIKHGEIEYIFKSHYQSLCRYLRLYTQDFDLIEDTVQSIFVKLWEERETIEITYIKTYLYVSAKNHILNSLRNSQRQTDLLQEYFINELMKEEGDDIINLDDFMILLEDSVNQLPDKMREIYRMSRNQQMSYKEIALHENISVKTVENHISKALKRISDYIKLHSKRILSIFL